MDNIFESNVLEISVSEGVGPLVLAQVPGFARFGDVLSVGKPCHYMIKAVDNVGRPTGAYEYGVGIYSATNQMTRTTVLGSSAANTRLNLAAGSKLVSFTALAPTTDALRFDWQSAIGLDIAGAVQYFAMPNLPAGWLKCNGAAVSRTTYARLFNRISTIYGGGDGASTFNVPDLRGEFIRGWDDQRGLDGGRGMSTLQGGQNLSHNHGISDPGHAHGLADPGHAHSAWTDTQGTHGHIVTMYGRNLSFNSGGNSYRTPYTQDGNGDMSATSDGGAHAHNVGVGVSGTGQYVHGAATGVSVAASGGNEVRPRNMALLACIKY